MVQTPISSRRRARLRELWRTLEFSRRITCSLPDCLRFFYLAQIKPGLVFRRWTRHTPEKVHSFRIKVLANQTYEVCVRDNGLDIGTIIEFFSPDTIVFPANATPFQPKVVYDIGANIGIASLYFSAAFPTAKVYGFEPLPTNFDICKLNYRNLPRAEAFPWAVGARTEVTTFECQNDPRGGRLHGISANPHLRTEKQIPVQVYSVEDLIRSRGLPPPDFLKIDVEGAELDVLKGLENCLGSVKRIFVETHGPELKAACLKWIKDRAFVIIDSQDDTAIWGHRN